ncbi:Actin cortical patch SUR7/pH-response regulator PalI [Kalmanozyma brasiliensis GHG001]|uniref:Integral membrane protein n=1 Tax=Kalmanozyma brasiliensis (strain GHG001) TaxID=1365824 RepID=V5EHB1_KALBG|nr:Actin cortical patch SUR7/pH-response regulator PalI [Kalmanozyma brasiliensis GHG001]EST09976.1 Actin cortical patch SUR7/pH-response regulator PalI [Kalmanozyma brasiliensis GHG001]
MVFRGLCVGLGGFFSFAAVVLCVFANIGQLSNNVVTRNIRYVSVDTRGLGDALSRAGQSNTNIFAQDQSSPVGQGNGIKDDYQWGLYNYCAGEVNGDSRSCSQRNFGFEFLPADAVLSDTPQGDRQTLQNFLPESTFRDSGYLGRFSKAAMYLIFIGSCLALIAWVAGLLSHRFAFLGAAFIALLSALALGVGAALLTAIYVKTKASIDNANFGITIHYGNALWITWAAVLAVALSIVPYIISCCTGRSDDY